MLFSIIFYISFHLHSKYLHIFQNHFVTPVYKCVPFLFLLRLTVVPFPSIIKKRISPIVTNRGVFMNINLTSDKIYKILENEIVQLKIQPGDFLSENTLCKRFQISRTPIRSVLQRLQQAGFVQIVPHKGTIVTSICLKLANQWIFQRMAVECMVLRDFINICTPADVAHIRYAQECLQKIADKLKNAPEEFDINEFLVTDLSMHKIWFQATDKMFLWENLIRPQADYSRFIRLDVVGGRNVPDVMKEHQELIDVIENRDFTAIEPLLKRHLYGGMRRMGSQLFSEEYQRFFTVSEKSN